MLRFSIHKNTSVRGFIYPEKQKIIIIYWQNKKRCHLPIFTYNDCNIKAIFYQQTAERFRQHFKILYECIIISYGFCVISQKSVTEFLFAFGIIHLHFVVHRRRHTKVFYIAKKIGPAKRRSVDSTAFPALSLQIPRSWF